MDNVPASTWAIIAFLWVLNVAISAWNSYAVGRAWPHTKQLGGWMHWMAWMGYVQAIAGFSYCFLIPLVLLAYSQHWLGFGVREVSMSLKLGYLIIAPAIVVSGLFIWIDSLIHAWREKTLTSFATAGWNTYAQLTNMYDLAVNAKPFALEVFGYFTEGFSDGDDEDRDSAKGRLVLLVLGLVVLSLVLGWLAAAAISGAAARSEARRFRLEMSRTGADAKR